MMRICIAGRNHAAFVEECLASVLAQRVELSVDWTDDASDTPEAAEIAHRMLRLSFSGRGLFREDARVRLGVLPYATSQCDEAGREYRGFHRVERRHERRGGLANLWHAIQRAAEDDVCVLMGGDDWLEPGGLARVAKAYEDPETWLTYGSYQNARPRGRPREGPDPVPPCREWTGCDIRPYDFLWMPLTCRTWLAKKVLVEDLKIAGWWQWSGGDVALNVPMVEMAGPAHARFIPDVWYTRRLHADNDTAIDANLQYYCNWISYGRPRYSRLASREDAPVRTPHRVNYSLLFSPNQPAPRSVIL
jgi:glycosyltransferase involved in cell wall biosynthesis